MMEDYRSALRAGQRAYRASVARGQSPYLALNSASAAPGASSPPESSA